MAEKIKAGHIIGVLAGLGALGGIIYAATRVEAVPPPEGAEIIIEIIGPDGELVPSGSPVSLTEGEVYTVRVTITNLSTKAGQPWEATLTVGINAGADSTILIPTQSSDEYFAANQSRVFNYPMPVPLGSGGESGDVFVSVKDPIGVVLASATELVTIAEVPIIYGAIVTIG